ncbi:hypothetical protein NFI96_001592 [Prochilodus magdalenae]|nr:hypothetical protein NFI96_001592 [Prochilodus magdalenae]
MAAVLFGTLLASFCVNIALGVPYIVVKLGFMVPSLSPTRPTVTSNGADGSAIVGNASETAAPSSKLTAIREYFTCHCSNETSPGQHQPGAVRTCRPCPEGWTHLEGKCYSFGDHKMDWKTSKEACVSMRSHLTVLLTDQQHAHLEKVAHDMGGLDYHYWIGLTDSEEEGVWKWVDNTLVNKTYWNERSKEPNNHESGGVHGEDCAVLEPHSKSWYDVPCDFQYKPICEMDDSTAVHCSPCPEGWTHVEGKCYSFSDNKMDWKNSTAACLSMGSRLPVHLTDQQHAHLEKVAHDMGGLDYHYWIGLTDSEEEGVWKWVDNTLVNKTYWNEKAKEPNNDMSGGDQGEDCAVLEPHSKSWFDVPCDFQYKRICEMDALNVGGSAAV